MKLILFTDIINEINKKELLAASLEENLEGGQPRVAIEYLGKVGGDRTVGEAIEQEFSNPHLKFVDADESAAVAYYELTDEIYAPCEGGIAVFETIADRDTWLKQE